MALHPNLVSLQQRLEQLGTVAVTNPDYIEIRLPLFCTVRVRYDDDRFSMEPFFGAVPRGRSTLLTTALVAIGTPALFLTAGATPLVFAIAFLALASRVYEATRYVLTEAAVTRVQLLANTERGSAAQASIGGAATRDALRDGGVAGGIRQPQSLNPESIQR